MRPVVSYVLIAAVAGFVGASFSKAPELIDKIASRADPASDPAGFWSTPAIEGYGKMHYEPNVAYKPNVNDSNKIVFQITKAENGPNDPNLGFGARGARGQSVRGFRRSSRKTEVCGFGHRRRHASNAEQRAVS